MLSIVAGVGAFALLDRPRTQGTDRALAALMVVALASSGLGIPILLGVGVELALTKEGRERLWVVAAPFALYLLWYVAYGTNRAAFEELSLSALWAWTAANHAAGAIIGERQIEPGQQMLVLVLLVLAYRAFRVDRAGRIRLAALAIILLTFYGADRDLAPRHRAAVVLALPHRRGRLPAAHARRGRARLEDPHAGCRSSCCCSPGSRSARPTAAPRRCATGARCSCSAPIACARRSAPSSCSGASASRRRSRSPRWPRRSSRPGRGSTRSTTCAAIPATASRRSAARRPTCAPSPTTRSCARAGCSCGPAARSSTRGARRPVLRGTPPAATVAPAGRARRGRPERSR